MPEASLELQKAVRARLVADGALMGLVRSEDAILDRHSGPEVFPSITLGEDQVTDDSASDVVLSGVFVTIHIWSRDLGMSQAKTIAGAIRRVLRAPLGALAGHALVLLQFRDTRFLRDPDGATAHAVMTFEALIQETA